MSIRPLFTGVNHIAVVTGNIDRAVRAWWERYRIGPWDMWTKGPSNMSSLAGDPEELYTFRAAMCQISPSFRIELIQPLDDQGPYARSLAERGGADHIHHVRFDVADYGTAREQLGRLGVHVVADEQFAGAPGETRTFRATYFDTEAELGFTLQIGEGPAGFVMPDPDVVYPPAP